jgi:RNase P protein component
MQIRCAAAHAGFRHPLFLTHLRFGGTASALHAGEAVMREPIKRLFTAQA